MLHVVFFEPRIPGNTGAAIRLSANSGSMLHVVDPLFEMEDSKLRRAVWTTTTLLIPWFTTVGKNA